MVAVPVPLLQPVNTAEKTNNVKIRFLDFMLQVVVSLLQNYVIFSNIFGHYRPDYPKMNFLFFKPLVFNVLVLQK